jgi:heptosyltransferase-2
MTWILPSTTEWQPVRPAAGPVGSRYRYSKWYWRILSHVIDGLGEPLVRFARRLRPVETARDPRSILVVQLDHVGDAVLTTPLFRALRERYPRAAIDVLASDWNREIFAANPQVRRVHISGRNWQGRTPWSRGHVREVLQMGRAMRRFGYDLGIDVRGDVLIALVLWLAGIPRRLGWGSGGGGFLFTDVPAWNPDRHEVAARLALLNPLGIFGGHTEPEVHPTWSDRAWVRELLAALPEPSQPLVVLHVSAGTPAKRWPLAYFATLIDALVSDFAATVLLVGERDDRERGQRLARHDGRVFDWTGRLTLMQLAALLDEADLFVGADSGPAHLAAAMGAPSVVLFSGTNRLARWRPAGPQVQTLRAPVACSPCHLKSCPFVEHPCMTGIRPAEVVQAIRSILPQGTQVHSEAG